MDSREGRASLSYRLEVQCKPLHEAINSLHTYICRKSHKKIDLGSAWVKETRKRLTPEFAALLDEVETDHAWKITYLLVQLSPAEDVEAFLGWLEGLTVGDLYELISAHTNQFPEQMGDFRSRTLTLFSQWYDQYASRLDPAVAEALQKEKRERTRQLAEMPADAFVDETTNGLVFLPTPGMERLILIPQYHFQPLNVIYSFGAMTVCHYAARIYFGEEDEMATPDYRMIRSLSEKSRLKILRYLHRGPRSFIEIVRHLQLSKGITHDHITKLRMAGMIHAHFEGESVIEYSLRSGALERMHLRLQAYIEQG